MRIDLRLMMVSLSCAALLFATPAFAEDEAAEVGAEAADTEDTATEDTDTEDTDTGDIGDTGDTDTGDETDAPASSGGYPIAELERPQVLPPMMLEVRGGLTFARLSLDLGPLGSSSANWVGLFAGAGFGIMEGLEAGIGGGGFFTSGPGLGLTLSLSPEVEIGDLPLYGMYDLTALIGVPNLQIAGRLTLNLPLSSQFSVLADAPVKYKLTDMVAIIGSAGLGAQIGDGSNGLLIAINGGALIQATEQIAASATIGMLTRLGGGSPVLIPLSLRGEFNVMEPLDVFVDFSFVDLNNWGPDWIIIQGGAAFRLPL